MEPSERSKLVRQRSVVKGSLTRIGKFVDQFEQGSDLNSLRTRLKQLPSIWDNYTGVQIRLELEDDEASIEGHAKDRETFENTYYDIEARMTTLIEEGVRENENNDNRSEISRGTSQHSPSHIRLPVINLPSFHGQYESWIHFRDTFQALIINNESLSDIQRYHYLLSSLKGEAHQLVQNLPISNDNFRVAWDIVCTRYNNKKLIATQHVKALLSLPACQKSCASDLRQLNNHITSNLNAVECLGLDIPLHEILLQQLVMDKLDHVTRKEFEVQAPSDNFSKLSEVSRFLEERAQILELMHATKEPKATASSAPRGSQPKQCNKASQLNSYVATNDECEFCNAIHPLHKCEAFAKSSIRQRYDFVKSKGLCFNCFRHHNAVSCKSGGCKLCNRKHHTLIHFNSSPAHSSENNIAAEQEQSNSTYCALKFKPQSHVLLSTAIIQAFDAKGRPHQCRVLLDNGSQSHFITEAFAKTLGLKRCRNSVPINGINNVAVTASQSVDVCIRSNVSSYEATITCSVLPQITGNLPPNYIDCRTWNLPTDIKLADPTFNKPGCIDMLIGAELFMQLMLEGWRKNSDDLPILKNTVLGWIVSGPIRGMASDNTYPAAQTALFVRHDNDLDLKMERFWKIEEMNTTQTLSTMEEQYCEEHFINHTRRDNSGRFVVRLPVKRESPQLGLSYSIALKRFKQLELKLTNRPELREAYIDFMQDYERLGHMEQAADSPKELKGYYYMPHHAVFKEQSTTTKTRVVFDASCKTDNGISLNNTLAVGPTVQQDLLTLVTRFRVHQVALTADITKMYRQVRMDDRDADLQRIIWRNNPKEPLRIYRLKTVTYGTSSASYLATRCLIQLADDEAEQFPRASQILKQDFYVDDAIFGTDTVEEAIRLREQLQELLSRGGFHLRKWCSSHPAVLESIPTELRESQPLLKFDEKMGIKTLGLLWCPMQDEFQYELNIRKCTEPFTKRIILSIICSIFDPLGLLGPVIVSAKVLMQRLWQARIGWDEPLPPILLQTWQDIYIDLPALNDVRVGRMVLGKGKIQQIQVHGFADASEKAYGACVYIRSITEDGKTHSNLVCSKSRVAPLKQQSIPRLELCGALLLSRLVAKTLNALNLKIDGTFLWTDSTIVLAWIAAGPKRWKTFVANRVAEIQQLTTDANWGHVLSEYNPADALSRGKPPHRLQDEEQWWRGPAWLRLNESNWPNSSSTVVDEPPEQRNKTQCLLSVMPSDDITTRFSSVLRLQRVVAYCIRFSNNARAGRVRRTGQLSSEELASALDLCIRQVQRLTYSREIEDLMAGLPGSSKSPIRSLNPFLDGSGVLRVGGRLQNSMKTFAERHPIILPPKHNLTQLIVTAEHLRLLHAGSQHLIASLRCRYWIVNARQIVRSVIHKCVKCFRLKASTAKQLMGELPRPRVTPSRPFLNTGVDYAGPLYIKQGNSRTKTKVKCYVALFICLCTKAVHLELVRDMTSQAFIAALRRFTSRRGKCAHIYSDNGTNFVGAKNELEELRNMFNSEEAREQIEGHAAQEGIKWHFIPPDAPHFGGLWEAGIKSMKHHLRRTAGNACLTFDEMYTLLCQIEACLNSRPLIRLPNDHDDLLYLSPGHFLIGAPLLSIPEPDLTKDTHSHISRWRFIQSLQQNFWKQWSSDYLHSLQQRYKWQSKHPNLEPETVVLLKDDHLPPLSWRLAVIQETIPGKDGRVRTAIIRTSTGTFKRPIHKLCPLPMQE